MEADMIRRVVHDVVELQVQPDVFVSGGIIRVSTDRSIRSAQRCIARRSIARRIE
jgi:hypothetical protein